MLYIHSLPCDFLFLFFKNIKYFNTHKKRQENLKETNSDVFSKELNSWIHNNKIYNM